jgi:hypothetical protein
MSDWATRIKELWRASGQTQADWGAPFGLTGPEVTRIVTGRVKRKPNHELWVKIQAALAGNPSLVAPPPFPQSSVFPTVTVRADAGLTREMNEHLARQLSLLQKMGAKIDALTDVQLDLLRRVASLEDDRREIPHTPLSGARRKAGRTDRRASG